MNCWEILGIEPTHDRHRIEQAYEQQKKFASGEEAERLAQAFREATGEAPPVEGEPEAQWKPEASDHSDRKNSGREVAEDSARSLDASEAQVVREVVIQVKALLNDSARSRDPGIWKAILREPPADQPAVRQEIARQLEPQLRPMAQNGSFPPPVAQFLGDWFDWPDLKDASAGIEEQDEQHAPEPESADVEDSQPPQMVNFWPAVIGWIVGLAILTALFGGMGGSG